MRSYVAAGRATLTRGMFYPSMRCPHALHIHGGDVASSPPRLAQSELGQKFRGYGFKALMLRRLGGAGCSWGAIEYFSKGAVERAHVERGDNGGRGINLSLPFSQYSDDGHACIFLMWTKQPHHRCTVRPRAVSRVANLTIPNSLPNIHTCIDADATFLVPPGRAYVAPGYYVAQQHAEECSCERKTAANVGSTNLPYGALRIIV